MKKIILSTITASFLFSNLMAGDFEENFKNALKPTFKDDKITIIKKIPYKSIQGLNFVTFKSEKSKDEIAMLASDDGKSVFSYPKFAIYGNDDDAKMIEENIKNLEFTKLARQQKEALKILKTIPEDRFLNINSFYKDNPKTIYMITDPECPYCREEMAKIVKWLRNAHLKIIFAPVHGESAYTKAAIILREGKKLGANKQDEIIKIIKKYYAEDAKVDKNQASDKERDAILNDAKTIFSKGVVEGVPFKIEVNK